MSDDFDVKILIPNPMDEIVPGLWLGELRTALNVPFLKEHKIYSVVSAMRPWGKLIVNETFVRHQIELDDKENADILTHFLPAISFIQAELDKGRGVLVHCHAGVSRSPTIVAAYLMYSQNIDPATALDIIKKARPAVDPNPGFLRQLELFHQAQYKISTDDKAVRRFYLDKAVENVKSGDGSPPGINILATAPSMTSGQNASVTRRRIRCKMCRQDLATREYMLHHGQLAPLGSSVISTGASLADTPADTRSQDLPDMSSLKLDNGGENSASSENSSPVPSKALSSTADAHTIVASQLVGRQLSDAIVGANDDQGSSREKGRIPDNNTLDESSVADANGSVEVPTSHFNSPRDLSAPLISNPMLAALRSPSAMPLRTNVSPKAAAKQNPGTVTSSPLLINSKCSGYFVEPMKWMEHFLSTGLLSGKITCPNKRCGAKLGNFDWAGMKCGCEVWVVPAFCINRSKVDEVV